jgi:hypothetical protein
LSLELLVAELELLDCSGELPDLRFEALKAKHEIRPANLRGPLQRLRWSVAFTRYAFASAEEQVQQSRGLAVLGPCRAKIRASSKGHHESERGCPSRDKASH